MVAVTRSKLIKPTTLVNLPPDMLRLIASRLQGSNRVHLATTGSALHDAQRTDLQSTKRAMADEEDRLVTNLKGAVRALQELVKLRQPRRLQKLSHGFEVTQVRRDPALYSTATQETGTPFRGITLFVELMFIKGLSAGMYISTSAEHKVAYVQTTKYAGGSTTTESEILPEGRPIHRPLARVLKRVAFAVKL